VIRTREYNSVLSGLIEIEYYRDLVISEGYILKNTTASYQDWKRLSIMRSCCIWAIHTKEYNSVLSGLIEIEYYRDLVISEGYILKNTTASYPD